MAGGSLIFSSPFLNLRPASGPMDPERGGTIKVHKGRKNTFFESSSTLFSTMVIYCLQIFNLETASLFHKRISSWTTLHSETCKPCSPIILHTGEVEFPSSSVSGASHPTKKKTIYKPMLLGQSLQSTATIFGFLERSSSLGATLPKGQTNKILLQTLPPNHHSALANASSEAIWALNQP